MSLSVPVRRYVTIQISETLLETIIIASVRVVVALFSVDLSQDRILVSLHPFHLSGKLCEGICHPSFLSEKPDTFRLFP